MFFGATSFNQDISNWCVQLKGSEPTGWADSNPTFGGNAAFQPSWGTTCSGNSVVISFNDVTKTFGDSNFTVAATSNQSNPNHLFDC